MLVLQLMKNQDYISFWEMYRICAILQWWLYYRNKKEKKERKGAETWKHLFSNWAHKRLNTKRVVKRAGKPGLATLAGVQHEPNSFNSVQGNVHTRKHPLDINTLLISSSLCDPGYYTVP